MPTDKAFEIALAVRADQEVLEDLGQWFRDIGDEYLSIRDDLKKGQLPPYPTESARALSVLVEGFCLAIDTSEFQIDSEPMAAFERLCWDTVSGLPGEPFDQSLRDTLPDRDDNSAGCVPEFEVLMGAFMMASSVEMRFERACAFSLARETGDGETLSVRAPRLRAADLVGLSIDAPSAHDCLNFLNENPDLKDLWILIVANKDPKVRYNDLARHLTGEVKGIDPEARKLVSRLRKARDCGYLDYPNRGARTE